MDEYRRGRIDSPGANQKREALARLRDPLFELHRLLLSQVRDNYEEEAGRVSPQAFFNLLLNEPRFQWLRPFSSLLSAIDEALDNPPEDPSRYQEVLDQVEQLFRFSTEETAFSLAYKDLIQASPEIASCHGELRLLLPKRGPEWS